MKQIIHKSSMVVVIIMLLLPFCNAQSEYDPNSRDFIFKITVNDIEESSGSIVNDWIDYENNTTTLPPWYKWLFGFYDGKNPNLGRLNVYYSVKKGILVVNSLNENGRLVYQLFSSRIRLRNGNNILQFEGRKNLLWLTSNSGVKSVDLQIGNGKGEGILTTLSLDLFADNNLTVKSDFTSILASPERPERPTRPLSEFFNLKSLQPNVEVVAGLSSIQIFPNPTYGKVIVQLAVGMEDAAIIIFNSSGSVIATNNDSGLQRNINLFGKPGGIYLVKVTTKNGVNITKQLIIQ